MRIVKCTSDRYVAMDRSDEVIFEIIKRRDGWICWGYDGGCHQERLGDPGCSVNDALTNAGYVAAIPFRANETTYV